VSSSACDAIHERGRHGEELAKWQDGDCFGSRYSQ
jgi:hypothetical protein